MINDNKNPNRSELRIEFSEREGSDGRKYFLAKPRLPVTLDLRDTALFLWVDKDGNMSMTFRVARTGFPDKREEEDVGGKERRPLMAFGDD